MTDTIWETTPCKICSAASLSVFAHTAKCTQCGVLLCFPYPKDDEWEKNLRGDEEINRQMLKWHLNSGSRNHHNFTRMAEFALSDDDRYRDIRILDYGGGGGEFALVLKSLFPLSETYIVDVADAKLLDHFRPLNRQIRFKDFPGDETRFDFIFMNDVFEHVNDPLGILTQLHSKLANSESKIFIDTPCQFWIYPLTKVLSSRLHTKILTGTVDYDHQQIWSRNAFETIVRKAGFTIDKYVETSEFTQPAGFYMKNMGIRNPVLRMVGRLFYRFAPVLARNKIMSVIRPT